MTKPEAIPDPLHPKPAPIEFAGQWVAWNKERTEIVAHGTDMAAVHAAAMNAGYPEAILQRVRRPDVSFIYVETKRPAARILANPATKRRYAMTSLMGCP